LSEAQLCDPPAGSGGWYPRDPDLAGSDTVLMIKLKSD
jgi:hypothetical protein